jgi:hypothetical protein
MMAMPHAPQPTGGQVLDMVLLFDMSNLPLVGSSELASQLFHECYLGHYVCPIVLLQYYFGLVFGLK